VGEHPVRVRYVKAKLANSCVIASLAMVTGESFAQVRKGLLEFWQDEGQFQGIGDDVFDEYLAQRGYAMQYQRHEYNPRFLLRDQWPPAPFAPVHVCDVFDQGKHAVVMLADGRVLDPSDRKRRALTEYHRVFGVCGIWYTGAPLADLSVKAKRKRG
jgi:hypothetical protein